MLDERGVALLEVLMALAIIGIAGGSLVAAVAESVHVTEEVVESEHQAVRRSDILTSLSLLTDRELQERIGTRPLGAFQLAIVRPRVGLYRIEVTGPLPSTAASLGTLVYRDPRERLH